MIEFNLLPEVKLEYIKVNRIKRLVVFASMLAAAVFLAIMLILLVFVDGFQKKSIRDINSDIAKYKSQIQSKTDLNKVLTIQNQLASLPNLNQQKPVTSRLFTFLQQLTPASVTLSSVDVDFSLNTLTLNGNADSLKTVNQYVDTLKFTTYQKSSTDTSNTPAFTQVVLGNFGLTGEAASYEIHAAFDPLIFNQANSVTLTVPNITSTRSIVEQPTDIFKQSTTK